MVVQVTRREEIYELLKKSEMSAQDLANLFHCTLFEIETDLMHLAKSVRPKYELRMYPARCKSCGFIFKQRTKIRRPSKCPKCREERISSPLFKIEEAAYKKKKVLNKDE